MSRCTLISAVPWRHIVGSTRAIRWKRTTVVTVDIRSIMLMRCTRTRLKFEIRSSLKFSIFTFWSTFNKCTFFSRVYTFILQLWLFSVWLLNVKSNRYWPRETRHVELTYSAFYNSRTYILIPIIRTETMKRTYYLKRIWILLN